MRILIVDDHSLFREGLASLLDRQPDFEVVGQAATAQEAVTAALRLLPDLVLMDFSLPDGTGLDATRRILAAQPQIQIVFLTMHADDERLIAAIQAGAKGYLLKDLPINKLLVSLRGLEHGQAPLSRTMTASLMSHLAARDLSPRPTDPFVSLTSREREVLAALVHGASNAEIGERLFISENTVKNHVHNILEKVGAANRRELIALAAHSSFSEHFPDEP